MIAAITGANGFIGQHLVRRFADAGWETREVIRRDFEVGDRELERKFDRADVVVHAAGATRAPTRRELHESNVHLTARVIEAARRAQVGRLILLSSQAAAGPAASCDAAINEDNEPSPLEAYGRSKLEAERLMHSMSGMPFVILRPAAVYGPGDRDFLTMFRLARRGLAIHPGNRDHWISIVHVDDVASGVILASTGAHALGRTFFIANEEPVQWGQLFTECAACVKRSLAVNVEIPASVVSFAARAGDVVARLIGRAGLLTSEKVALGLPRYWICSSERARRELGWSPRVRRQDGLLEAHRWYRAHGWL